MPHVILDTQDIPMQDRNQMRDTGMLERVRMRLVERNAGKD